jgi:NAD(P)H-quinone oxidoreductase subunit 4L
MLAVAYGLGTMAFIEPATHVPADVLLSFLLVLAAFLAVGLGGDRAVVTIISTLFVFFTLTLFQSDPIKYMTLAAVLFCIGFYGLIVSRNAVRVLMSIELMLNAVNINMVTMARYVDPSLRGQVFAIFILTVAAAEAAVGLAIVLAVYRNMATVDMERFNLLKW